MAAAVEMRNITKKFPGVTANQNVNFRAEWGQIHGLIGENGAGKTTLMKILYGMEQPDEGEIFIDGTPAVLSSPKEAIKRNIGMVHQHFTLVPSLTVAENITMAKPTLRNGLIDLKKAAEIVFEMGERFGLKLDPYVPVKQLPVGLQQRVEILKALYLGADILIMDEPTAVLTPQEITQLFVTLKSLKEQGKTIILITHKLKELMNATDVITVMRSGQIVGHMETRNSSEEEIARMMVGKDVQLRIDKKMPAFGKEVLTLKGITHYDKRGVKILDGITFSVREGEIVGIAGVQGNGQTELIEVIAGLKEFQGGELILNGRSVSNSTSPMQRRHMGLGHVAEDRQTMGAALDASILENFMMGGHHGQWYRRGMFLRYKRAEEIAWEQIRHFDVRTSDIRLPARSLSGGNLQKLIIAREMFLNPLVLIAAQPTRGVDIGASQFIHRKLIEMRDEGKAVLLISNELSEIMSLSDRVLVIYNGSIVGETTPEKSTEEEIGLWMAGIRSASRRTL
jgi:simple sugar transport system ATP-binding protein